MHSLVFGNISQFLPNAQALGESLAGWWYIHAITLMAGSALFGHLTLLLLFTAQAKQAKAPSRWLRGLALPFEIYFCLLNPLIYLLIFTRSSGETELFVDVGPSVLDPVAGWLLVGVWSLRLVPALRHPPLIRAILYLCICWLGLYAIKDGLLLADRPSMPLQGTSLAPVFLLGNLCLYLAPIAILAGYLRRRRADRTWAGADDFFLMPTQWGAAVALLGTVLVYGFSLILTAPPSETESRTKIREHRKTIVRASGLYGLDPLHVGALIYVVNQDQASPFARYLESMAMGGWLTDPTSDLLLADSLDLSIGLTQIKPTTAQTALMIVRAGQRQELVAPGPHREYGEVPALGPNWLLPRNAMRPFNQSAGTSFFFPLPFSPFPLPRLPDLPDKQLVVRNLMDETTSIYFSAFILGLYATQWESADPAWSIRTRPEILATLYQLGFERSQPKAEPRSLPFGHRVAEVASSGWLQTLLQPTTLQSE